MRSSIRFVSALALGSSLAIGGTGAVTGEGDADAQARRPGLRGVCPRPGPPRDGSRCRPPEGRTCMYPQEACRCVNAGPHRGLEWECHAVYVRVRPMVGPLEPPTLDA